MRIVQIAMVAGLLLAAGCSQRDSERDYSGPASDQAQQLPKVQYEPDERAAPGVDVTAAPGVAFNYCYAFRLPSERIAGVQEAHAQACEKLGLDRCRITGMRYRLVNQKDIEAMLALRLDPAVARNFGKQASEAVTKAEGMLVDLEISGEDVGTQIKTATRSETKMRADLADIERQLANLRVNDPNRGELAARAEELRRDIRALGESKAQGEEALAGTPMVFNYGSGRVIPGFDVRSPLRDSIASAGNNVIGGFAAILFILITLLPWLLLLGVLYYLWKIAQQRMNRSAEGYRSELAETSPPPEAGGSSPRRRSRRKPDQP